MSARKVFMVSPGSYSPLTMVIGKIRDGLTQHKQKTFFAIWNARGKRLARTKGGGRSLLARFQNSYRVPSAQRGSSMAGVSVCVEAPDSAPRRVGRFRFGANLAHFQPGKASRCILTIAPGNIKKSGRDKFGSRRKSQCVVKNSLEFFSVKNMSVRVSATENPCVGGSIPPQSTKLNNDLAYFKKVGFFISGII
jgi:hypothetical protein